MQENNYYILDEPFNGIDIQSNVILTEVLLTLKKMNKCIIISSHILSTLTESCDAIHLLRSGQIAKTYTTDEFYNLERDYQTSII